MRSWDWDQRYSATESVWGSEPNPLPGRGGGRASGRPGVGPRVRRGAQRGLAGRAGLDKARRLAAERGVDVDWIHADLLDDQPPEAAFDLVMRLYLHLPSAQRRRVLEKGAGARAPAAMLLVIGHDRLNLTEGWGGPRNPRLLFTPAEVVRELPGLRIERAERVFRPVAGEGGTVRAVDALVRARRPVEAGRSPRLAASDG
jgi:hypothetical protein